MIRKCAKKLLMYWFWVLLAESFFLFLGTFFLLQGLVEGFLEKIIFLSISIIHLNNDLSTYLKCRTRCLWAFSSVFSLSSFSVFPSFCPFFKSLNFLLQMTIFTQTNLSMKNKAVKSQSAVDILVCEKVFLVQQCVKNHLYTFSFLLPFRPYILPNITYHILVYNTFSLILTHR